MIKYNVNEEKGIVVAYFDGGNDYIKDCITNRMHKVTRYTYGFNTAFEKIVRKELGDTNFIGKSKVNFDAGDKFDLEIGKIMAHDRLLKKYYRLEKRIANRIISFMKKDYTDMIEKLERI